MKNLLLKTMVLALVLLGGVSVSWAQSTYTWDATKWIADGNGSITSTSDNKITGQAGQYLFGLQYNGEAFKIPKRQTFLVIKGENILKGNEPKLKSLNGTSLEQGGFTVNAAHTLAYKDITEYLPSETDFVGNVTISGVAVWLQKPGDSDSKDIVVESIDFVAADILDVVETSNIANLNSNRPATSIALSSTDGEFKKKLTFTQTRNDTGNEMGLKFQNLNLNINNSDMFFVVESNVSLSADNKLKLRNVLVDGTSLANGFENTATDYAINGQALSNNHYLTIHNFCCATAGETNGSAAYMQYAAEHASYKTTEYRLYMHCDADRNVEIYRLGFYNLAEIMKLYPELGTKWKFDNGGEGRLALKVGDSGNQIGNHSTAGSDNTLTTVIQRVRSLGSLPETFTQLTLRHFNFKADQQPLTYDIFEALPSGMTIFVNPGEYQYFPTMKTGVKIANDNYKYTQFKEGIAPGSTPEATTDGGGSNPWTSITRYFKAGYNSCVLPFNKPQFASLPAGLTVYTLSAYDSSTGTITFAKNTDNQDSNNTKNTPVIVKAETDGLYMILGRDAESSFDNYSTSTQGDTKFVGSYVNEVPSGDYASTSNFAITVSGIQKMGAEETTDYYRAFLSLPPGYDVQGNGNFTVDGNNITVSVGSAYAITVPDAVAGNSIAADKTTAVAGTTITLSPTLATGYQLTELKYNGTAIDLSEENYTFTMPATAVTITAKYAKVEKQDADSEKEVTETINLIDATHAEVTAVNISNDATSVSIPATVDGIPVTSIAADAFSGVTNKSEIKSINLSATSITGVEVNRSSGVFLGFDESTIIYMPASNTAATGEKNVVIGGTCADFEMNDETSYSIPTSFTATNAKLTRSFTAGKTATICLPYEYAFTSGGADKFYSFSKVEDNKVYMTEVTTSPLSANVPYIYLPNGATTELAATGVTIGISGTHQTGKSEGTIDFTFEGVVARKDFTDSEITNGVYCFAAEAEHGATEVGQFVKCTAGAYVPAFRAYLACTTELTAAASRGAESTALPDVLEVILVNSNGSTTSIGKLELINIDDNTPRYNLSGQRVGKDYKGIVIINGKKVFIK